MTARYLVGDAFERLAELPDNSVDLVMTSPPFLALRSYLPDDHPNKAAEIGSEPTPAAFLDTMLDLTTACERVLTPHGSICIELGDTYAGSGGAGGDYADGGLRDGQGKTDGSARRTRPVKASPDARSHREMGDGAVAITGGAGWPLAKSLTFMPSLFAASLAYGRNLLRPEHTIDPWRVRNLVAWVRPNPPVGALGDKVRPATSYLTWACKSNKRWFDLDAVRTPHVDSSHVPNGPKAATPSDDHGRGTYGFTERTVHPAGAPPLDWWKISPGGYTGSHYAVYPPELTRIPIEASCPRRVCTTCGEPSRRITEATDEYLALMGDSIRDDINGRSTSKARNKIQREGLAARTTTTTGWTTCGCPGTDGIRHDGYHTGTGWRPGVVLDPFAGSGSTLIMAGGLSRDAIGIDLDSRNADLAVERLGMFVEIDYGDNAPPEAA